VRAVVFDLFGTLLDNLEPEGWKAAFSEIAVHLGADPDKFWEGWVAGYSSRMDGSLPDNDHVFAPIASALGLQVGDAELRDAARMRDRFMRSCMRIKHDALTCLEALSARGYQLALATDCSSQTPSLLDETPLGAFFETRAISAELGVTKPHPAMYEHVLAGLGVSGDQCWYVGDGNSHELVGAKRQGMTTVWVDNADRQFHRERFSPEGDHTIRQLNDLLDLVP